MITKCIMTCLLLFNLTSVVEASSTEGRKPGDPYWRRRIGPVQPRPKHNFPSLEVCRQRARQRADSYRLYARTEAELQQIEIHYQELLAKCAEWFPN